MTFQSFLLIHHPTSRCQNVRQFLFFRLRTCQEFLLRFSCRRRYLSHANEPTQKCSLHIYNISQPITVIEMFWILQIQAISQISVFRRLRFLIIDDVDHHRPRTRIQQISKPAVDSTSQRSFIDRSIIGDRSGPFWCHGDSRMQGQVQPRQTRK